MVHKPDGTVRITVDYKPLNKIIKGDVYPLPNIAELYKRLADSDVFSKIDLKAAYHQIPMEEESIEYTAFTCEFGLFEYLSMPMGIKNAPAWFQRFMEETFRSFIDRKVLAIYLDDTIVHTNGLQAYKRILNVFFSNSRFEIRFRKCDFFNSKLNSN